jgi:transcriptional regulator with XRE-family HTH domain
MLQLSAAEVARRAGVGKSQLSKYETGKEVPKLSSLQRVVDIYGLDLAGLFLLVRTLDQFSVSRWPASLELGVLSQFVAPAETEALTELTAAVVRLFYANLNARVQVALTSTRKTRENLGGGE